MIAIADPGTANFGWLQPADAAQHRALHAFDGMNIFWYWINGVSTYFDNPGQTRQVIINWTPTSTDGTYYSLGANDIHLAAANPDSDHTTIHEGAHALMDAIYNDDFPPAPNCNPHYVMGASSTGCAWTEGWAEWVPARALNDPYYRWDNGAFLNLETPSWTTGEDLGDTVEGRVAGALIDLSDSTNEAPWDRYGEAEANGAEFEEIYATNIIQVSDTMNEYFNIDRPGEGDTGYLARTALFASTINYNQRDPLFSLGELTRPSLSVQPSPHNYSYNTGSIYWSGVAIRGTNDNDLVVYDDAAQTAPLASSAYGGTTIDYVLVDSNHRALGDYYPRANLWSGSGSYNIEWAGNANTLPEGSTSLSFGSGDVIQMRDVSVGGGVTNYVRVVPSGAWTSRSSPTCRTAPPPRPWSSHAARTPPPAPPPAREARSRSSTPRPPATGLDWSCSTRAAPGPPRSTATRARRPARPSRSTEERPRPTTATSTSHLPPRTARPV